MKIKTTETKSVKTEIKNAEILKDFEKKQIERLKKRGVKNIVSAFHDDSLIITYDK